MPLREHVPAGNLVLFDTVLRRILSHVLARHVVSLIAGAALNTSSLGCDVRGLEVRVQRAMMAFENDIGRLGADLCLGYVALGIDLNARYTWVYLELELEVLGLLVGRIRFLNLTLRLPASLSDIPQNVAAEALLQSPVEGTASDNSFAFRLSLRCAILCRCNGYGKCSSAQGESHHSAEHDISS